MAIGVQNDYTFYKGYEGEPEIIFQTDEHTLHIWDGYMGDIWGNPTEKDEEWCGFTRDYNAIVQSFLLQKKTLPISVSTRWEICSSPVHQ